MYVCMRKLWGLIRQICRIKKTERKNMSGWEKNYYYILIYVYRRVSTRYLSISSSSSSCRAGSTDIPDPDTFPYRSLHLAGLLDYIPYPHIVAECMFVLVVLLLLGHMWGSIRIHHLWVRPYFSSSVLHVWFV